VQTCIINSAISVSDSVGSPLREIPLEVLLWWRDRYQQLQRLQYYHQRHRIIISFFAIGTSSSSSCSTTTSAIELLFHLSRSVPAAPAVAVLPPSATRSITLVARSVPAAPAIAVLPPAPSNYYFICRDRYQQLQQLDLVSVCTLKLENEDTKCNTTEEYYYLNGELLFNYLPFRYLHNRIDFFIFFSIARMR
jgi:hypothetical protein